MFTIETINGEKLNYSNGKQAVEYLHSQGVINTLPAGNYNPFYVLAGVKKQGKIKDVQYIKKSEEQPKMKFETLPTNVQPSGGNEAVISQITALLSQALQPQKVESTFDEAKIREIVLEEIISLVPNKTEIKVNELPAITVENKHKNFEKLLRIISARVHPMLVGQAGSGKTTGVEQAAEVLSLPYYAISVGNQTAKHEFFGFFDANGKYQRTLFREAFENGGVFLIDEFDAGNSNVFTAINSALANGQAAFPDGMVKRHKDFICVMAGNTYGKGADRVFVGRNQIDAATLNRFKVIEWNYDEDFEMAISPNKEWTAKIQGLRAKAEKAGLRVIISPRASIDGAKLLAAGLTEAEVLDACIFQSLSADEKAILNK
jgi:hypothetical protein